LNIRGKESRGGPHTFPDGHALDLTSYQPPGIWAVLRRYRSIRKVPGKRHWRRGGICVLLCAALMTVVPLTFGLHHIYLDRTNLPAIDSLTQFKFPAVGRIYDANDQPILELAREYRLNIKYEDIPPIVRDAILAAEDKNFFAHNGIDYSVIPRVLSKIKMGALAARLTTLRRKDKINSDAIFPHGGSTITQQLVRGHFLKELTIYEKMTAQENNDQLSQSDLLTRALSLLIGSHSVNMLIRKLEEIRLSLWVESKLQEHFGSKRRAKEEILARYASLIYMGNGQYGFEAAAQYYFGRPLSTFTVEDADKAALLASIAKSPRHYAPGATNTGRILRRRNHSLELMASQGSISQARLQEARERPISPPVRRKNKTSPGPAVIGNALEELKGFSEGLSIEDLRNGRIQVYTTVDIRVQQIVDNALENGLASYEKRHPAARGLIQGSVVVLKNRNASILAETGGRQFYQDRSSSYSDFNRVTQSLRQPGSAMKPIVYLAAFQQGIYDLDTLVPDQPISVPDASERREKWISNYDGQFKGLIPLREALAQSRNAVAIWITSQIGIESILWTAQRLGITTPLSPYATTALGSSEVNLLELANAYRTMASGISARPYVIRKIVYDSEGMALGSEHDAAPVAVNLYKLALVQEGLRGTVRMPSGTAHALAAGNFPIPVMGKTGTTNDYRDALFIGSTYGPEGITVAVRIGFDDNRSLGNKETGGRVALPVFREIMLGVYRNRLAGAVPAFPESIEQNITNYMNGDLIEKGSPPEEGNPQNIEAPPNTEALRNIFRHPVALFY